MLLPLCRDAIPHLLPAPSIAGSLARRIAKNLRVLLGKTLYLADEDLGVQGSKATTRKALSLSGAEP